MNPHGTPIPYLRSWLGAAALAAGLSANGFAQAPVDPIERAKATQNLAEQKAENEIVEAIASADKLKTVSTPKAIQRLKEAQVGLFATRTSCQHFQSNQLRVLLAALAYVLIERLRALALRSTALANAQVHTLRIKRLKVAAVE